MMRRKFTESGRATVVQEFRPIVSAELGVDPSLCRRISFMTPPSPDVRFFITPYSLRNPETNEVTVINSARDAGLNQNYKGAALPPNTWVWFEITAEQTIVASASIGFANIGIITEYV